MKNQKCPLLLVLALSLCVITMPVAAKKGGHGNGNGHGNPHADSGDDSGANLSIDIHIGGGDRTIIKNYIAEDYHAHCPPGLAKKHNGCLPPGQAKKRYVVGQALPAAVVFSPVPSALLVKLKPVPAGFQYVQVDKDVLLISAATHKVVDAITLLSAVGK